mmetsp:Transcript_93386/g.267204  ORF Transcript_93386/g.267204 Transcript_93386/m.267204 type:complete len:430 (+) Transcript_93386:1426-2715(+)
MCQQGIPFGPDASQACDLYTKAADQGHVGAIFNLACLYRDGQCDVEQDLVRAKELFEAAAAKGHAAALCGLAGLHDAEGDHIGSFKLYKRAATSGYSTALHNVACALRSGEGVERNMEMALKYFEAAAARGHGKAQYNVGCMNAVGQGTAVNLVHARACFERAQNLGFANASVALKKVEKKLKKTKTQHVQKTNQMFGQRVVLTDPHALDATRLQAAAAQSTSGTCVDFDSSAKCYVVELDDGAGRIKVPTSYSTPRLITTAIHHLLAQRLTALGLTIPPSHHLATCHLSSTICRYPQPTCSSSPVHRVPSQQTPCAGPPAHPTDRWARARQSHRSHLDPLVIRRRRYRRHGRAGCRQLRSERPARNELFCSLPPPTAKSKCRDAQGRFLLGLPTRGAMWVWSTACVSLQMLTRGVCTNAVMEYNSLTK